jgi:lipoprotein-anchoring transpeptidase ErfK/SrfK
VLALSALIAALLVPSPAADQADRWSFDWTPAADQPVPARALVARVGNPVYVRAAPRLEARIVYDLVGLSEFSHGPEVLRVTGLRTDEQGHRWVRVLLPSRPNGRQGWVPRSRVTLQTTATRIVVRLRSRQMEVWREGELATSWAVGVGREATPTPIGGFAIQDPVRETGELEPIYGSRVLTLTAHSEVLTDFMGGDGRVAIHGTGGRPERIGDGSSFGCVLLPEPELEQLADLVKPGDPVDVIDA